MLFTLSKHSQDKYKVTARKRYGIKVLCSPSRAKSDAIDIDTFDEYKDLTDTIQAKKPSKITVFIDMDDVQRAFKRSRRGSGSESEGSNEEDEETNGEKNVNGPTDYERELARFRRLLEKKYQNDHDAGYTYINSATT